jgi:hypothetical protein
MLSSLLRPRKSRRTRPIFLPSPPNAAQSGTSNSRREASGVRHAAADWTETENDDEDSEDDEFHAREEHDGHDGEGDNLHDDEGDDEDGDEATPLLPIFSAAHLGMEYSLNFVAALSC